MVADTSIISVAENRKTISRQRSMAARAHDMMLRGEVGRAAGLYGKLADGAGAPDVRYAATAAILLAETGRENALDGVDRPALASAWRSLTRHRLQAGQNSAALATVARRREASGLPAVPLRIAPMAVPQWRARGRPRVWQTGPVTVLSGAKDWMFVDADGVLHLHDYVNDLTESGPHVWAIGTQSAIVADVGAAAGEALPMAVLLGGGDNYYHWLLDFFPRLGWLQQALAGSWRHAPLLLPDPLPPVQAEGLTLAGVGSHPRLGVPAPARILVSSLLASPVACHRQHLHPGALAWLRRVLQRRALRQAAPRIYVSRHDAGLRRVVNEAEVMAVLQPLGFLRLELAGMGLAEQAAAFSAAQVIVGPHGAGLANMVAAPPGCDVVELNSGGRPRGFMFALARDCGHLSHRLNGVPDPAPEQVAEPAVNQDFRVNCVALDALMRRILRRRSQPLPRD